MIKLTRTSTINFCLNDGELLAILQMAPKQIRDRAGLSLTILRRPWNHERGSGHKPRTNWPQHSPPVLYQDRQGISADVWPISDDDVAESDAGDRLALPRYWQHDDRLVLLPRRAAFARRHDHRLYCSFTDQEGSANDMADAGFAIGGMVTGLDLYCGCMLLFMIIYGAAIIVSNL